MALAAAITKYQVRINDDKRRHGMQRAPLITPTPRLYMLSAMAREIRPLQYLGSMMDSLPRPARPTASGPRYLRSGSCPDSRSGLGSLICHTSTCDVLSDHTKDWSPAP